MDISQLTTFFGWCTVINYTLLVFVTICVTLLRGFMETVHSRLFGVAKEDLPKIYFNYLTYSQAIMLPISLVPWLALKMM
jgi:hypothetical protein